MKGFVVALAMVLIGSASPVLAQKSDAKVKVKTTATKPDDQGRQTITLELTIDDGWHLYANPAVSDFFESVQTTLKIAGKTTVTNFKVEYPRGVRKEDKNPKIGEYFVYENKVTLKVALQRADATEPLVLNLRVTACSEAEMKCLQTSTIAVKVP